MITEQIELRRRLFVNVISICEKLYNYYVKRADSKSNNFLDMFGSV